MLRKLTLCAALVCGAVLLPGLASAHERSGWRDSDRGYGMRDRDWDRDRDWSERHDRGRHYGWKRGHHYGWGDHDRDRDRDWDRGRRRDHDWDRDRD